MAFVGLAACRASDHRAKPRLTSERAPRRVRLEAGWWRDEYGWKEAASGLEVGWRWRGASGAHSSLGLYLNSRCRHVIKMWLVVIARRTSHRCLDWITRDCRLQRSDSVIWHISSPRYVLLEARKNRYIRNKLQTKFFIYQAINETQIKTIKLCEYINTSMETAPCGGSVITFHVCQTNWLPRLTKADHLALQQITNLVPTNAKYYMRSQLSQHCSSVIATAVTSELFFRKVGKVEMISGLLVTFALVPKPFSASSKVSFGSVFWTDSATVFARTSAIFSRITVRNRHTSVLTKCTF